MSYVSCHPGCAGTIQERETEKGQETGLWGGGHSNRVIRWRGDGTGWGEGNYSQIFVRFGGTAVVVTN